MSNPRITPKERNLLKGAIRRVFSRSELRKKVIDAAKVEHSDPKRPRVSKWSRCAVCEQIEAQYRMSVDHIDPIIPVDTALERMTWNTVIDRTWCEENNLQAICPPCHTQKSRLETKQRTENKRKVKQQK